MLTAIANFFAAVFLQFMEDVISGKVQIAPPTATEAEADPVIQQRAADALADFDKANP